MKNEQRIWNKSELEQMPDWEEDSLDNWHHKSIEPWIVESMIGKPVQWCEDQGLTVTPEMIAKTETLESLQQEKVGIEKIINESDCSTDMLVNFTKDLETVNGKIKKLTEQPKTAIAANGTELVVGGMYRLESWDEGVFAEILFIGEQRIFCKYENENEFSWDINKNWLPYTDPKEEPKPLEGYQKWYVLNNNIIQTAYAEKKEEILKSLIGVIVYSEQEAIDLGLKL